jgi:uncharacterized protein DUF4235
VIKFLYKPVSMLLSALSGVLAGKVFEKAWKHLGDREAPSPTQKEAGWRDVLLSAALSGVIYAVVQAAISRGGAVGMEKATGVWPGEVAGEAA